MQAEKAGYFEWKIILGKQGKLPVNVEEGKQLLQHTLAALYVDEYFIHSTQEKEVTQGEKPYSVLAHNFELFQAAEAVGVTKVKHLIEVLTGFRSAFGDGSAAVTTNREMANGHAPLQHRLEMFATQEIIIALTEIANNNNLLHKLKQRISRFAGEKKIPVKREVSSELSIRSAVKAEAEKQQVSEPAQLRPAEKTISREEFQENLRKAAKIHFGQGVLSVNNHVTIPGFEGVIAIEVRDQQGNIRASGNGRTPYNFLLPMYEVFTITIRAPRSPFHEAVHINVPVISDEITEQRSEMVHQARIRQEGSFVFINQPILKGSTEKVAVSILGPDRQKVDFHVRGVQANGRSQQRSKIRFKMEKEGSYWVVLRSPEGVEVESEIFHSMAEQKEKYYQAWNVLSKYPALIELGVKHQLKTAADLANQIMAERNARGNGVFSEYALNQEVIEAIKICADQGLSFAEIEPLELREARQLLITSANPRAELINKKMMVKINCPELPKGFGTSVRVKVFAANGEEVELQFSGKDQLYWFIPGPGFPYTLRISTYGFSEKKPVIVERKISFL